MTPLEQVELAARRTAGKLRRGVPGNPRQRDQLESCAVLFEGFAEQLAFINAEQRKQDEERRYD